MAAINPYLTFNGNCGEVFDFYKSVFGGEFAMRSQFTDVPAEQPMSERDGEKIMHVSLPIGKGTVLMGSDTSDAYGPVAKAQGFSLSITAESEEEATKLFNGLSAGGRITLALNKTFWGSFFGMLTDKFGIQWMVSYDYK